MTLLHKMPSYLYNRIVKEQRRSTRIACPSPHHLWAGAGLDLLRSQALDHQHFGPTHSTTYNLVRQLPFASHTHCRVFFGQGRADSNGLSIRCQQASRTCRVLFSATRSRALMSCASRPSFRSTLRPVNHSSPRFASPLSECFCVAITVRSRPPSKPSTSRPKVRSSQVTQWITNFGW